MRDGGVDMKNYSSSNCPAPPTPYLLIRIWISVGDKKSTYYVPDTGRDKTQNSHPWYPTPLRAWPYYDPSFAHEENWGIESPNIV